LALYWLAALSAVKIEATPSVSFACLFDPLGQNWFLSLACFLCAVGFLSVLAYLDKQAQNNPFYLTFGEIEGYANACLWIVCTVVSTFGA
jgi:hypothetical protein